MFLDKESEFSVEQVLTVTAASTNHIDTINTINRVGVPLRVRVAIPVAFTAGGAATLVIAIRQDDTAAMASPTVISQTSPIPVASLKLGADIEMPQLPLKTQRYLDIHYTVATGPMTAGKIDAFLVKDEQTNGHAAMVEQKAAGAI